MVRILTRWRMLLLTLLWLLPAAAWLHAEKVADLPVPTAYVNDFAHILSPEASEQMESLARAAHTQAQADLFVVTIRTLDDGQSREEFTEQLIEKWKIGKKGVDRSTLLLLIQNPHGVRIETGYGLEGLLNDAKVGAILDQARAAAHGSDAVLVENAERDLAQAVADDAHVTLSPAPVMHQYHQEQAAQKIGPAQVLLGIGVVIVLFILIKTGNIGWAFYLVTSLMGGGGGGGRDDDEGGGFGGVGGGASGGGGASRDL